MKCGPQPDVERGKRFIELELVGTDWIPIDFISKIPGLKFRSFKGV